MNVGAGMLMIKQKSEIIVICHVVVIQLKCVAVVALIVFLQQGIIENIFK